MILFYLCNTFFPCSHLINLQRSIYFTFQLSVSSRYRFPFALYFSVRFTSWHCFNVGVLFWCVFGGGGGGASYISVNIYNFNSRLAHFNALWMEYIRSLRTGIMAEYPVMSTSQGTYVPIEQTSEAIRVTYKICRAGGREDWNWEPLLYAMGPQTYSWRAGVPAEFSSNPNQHTWSS